MANYGGYEDHPFLSELYDLVPGYTGRKDRDFFVKYCGKADGRILELGCGTGRILIPVAEAGCTITGLDLSEYMLARCRKKISALDSEVQKRITITQGNMADFNIDDTFHTAVIPFRAFQHLIDYKDQLSCLKNINRHLATGGRLIFDLFQVNLNVITKKITGEEIEDVPEYELPDGRKLRRTHRMIAYHRTEQYNDVEMIFYLTDKNGRTERLVQSFPMRYFFKYEIIYLLTLCGFKVVELFGNFDKSPLVDDSPEMIFVAEKVKEIES
jgi:ubiquinone/menaquinone biosynthesis C-methylase UbiE